MTILGSSVSIATSVFEYFSPTKSPYYAVVAFGSVAMVYSLGGPSDGWQLIYVPIAIALICSTILALLNKPLFSAEEYNNQLRFARSIGLCSALLCMAFTGVHIERPEAGAEIDNGWLFWLSWGASMIQILVFLLYIAVYGNYEERQQSQNFVQLSLVASTFIISLTYTNISLASSELESRSYWVLFTFVLLWLSCIVNLLQYLGKHFKVQRPG